MKGTILLSFILLFLVSLVFFGQSQIYAKSDNAANAGNQSRGNSSASDNKSNQGNQGTGSEKAAEKIKPSEGKSDQVNKSKESSAQDKKDKQDITQQFSSRGRGKITLLGPTEKISTRGAKLHKVKEVLIKESSVSAQANRRAVQGLITTLSNSVITLVHQIHRDRIYQILYNASTLIKFKNQESSSSASLQVGQRVVVIGDLNSAGQIVAKRIHVIPGKAIGIFKKQPLATPSATPFASPSATATSSAFP